MEHWIVLSLSDNHMLYFLRSGHSYRCYSFWNGSFIPTCVLRGISEVREVGHRTQLFGLRFQLCECFTQLVNHLQKSRNTRDSGTSFRAGVPTPAPSG